MQKLLLVLLLGLVASCRSDAPPAPAPLPPPPTGTLSRSVALPLAGLQLDTVYTAKPFALEAAMGFAGTRQDLVVHFGTAISKDEVFLRLPVALLRPGWVGTYTFRNVVGAASPYVQPVPGQVDLTHWFRYRSGYVATLTDYFYCLPGIFEITAYDAPRQLVSGRFRYEQNQGYIALPLLAPATQRFSVVLTGTFDNLPVAP